jgi:hypothetical protein
MLKVLYLGKPYVSHITCYSHFADTGHEMTVPAVPRLLYITLWEINCNIGRKKASCNAAKFRNFCIVKQNKMNI